MPKKILILCIDRDADLKVKAGISGPVIGRPKNIEAANNLLLNDPEEVDGNTIFEAVRLYDEMRNNGEEVEIATLTGDPSRGLIADRNISAQLDQVLSKYPAESCIFVSDGADDEQVLPVINSRIKVDAVKIVSMKQSKQLERTYFLILNKLKEPYFARIFIGVPALILLGLVISYSLGLEWRPVAALVGFYLLIKGFGFEDQIFSVFTSFKFRPDQVSFLSYMIAIPLFLLAMWLSLDDYASNLGTNGNLKAMGYGIRTLIIFLIPPMIMVYVGRIYDYFRKGDRISVTRSLSYLLLTFIVLYMIWMFASWVIAEAFFADLIKAIIISIIFGAGTLEIFQHIKSDLIKGNLLLGKEVYSSEGRYLGKVVNVNDSRKMFTYVNPWKKRIESKYDNVKSIDSRVVLS